MRAAVRTPRRVVAIAVAIALGAAAAAPPLAAEAAVDADSKASVGAAYRDVLLPALATDVGWTGSVDTCDPGTVSAASQDATLAAVNYMRQLAGLSSVTFDPALSAKAQVAALVYTANETIEHAVPTDWKCFTQDAADAGMKSNLAYGEPVVGALSVPAYMKDDGEFNTVVGHRRWVLNPSAQTMGSGSTPMSEVLWVQGATATKFKNPKWVAWPSAGFFPEQLEPDGRWSLSANAAFAYNFGKAKVSVTSPSGKKLKVKVLSRNDQGYGNDTIVWNVSGVKGAPGAKTAVYTVKVSGVKKGSKKLSYSYKVRMFDPTRG
jgi:uncharacterized protein YkwD